MKKLYVGNLSFDVEEDELSDVFKEYGEVVSANIVRDKWDKSSKGFGFIEFASDESADAAIEGLNGTEIRGRSMRVSEARPKPQGSGGGGGGGGGRHGRGGDRRGGPHGGRGGGGGGRGGGGGGGNRW